MKIVLEQSKSPMILADEDLPIFAQLVAIADMGMCDEVFQGEAKTIHKIKCMFVGYQKGDDGKLALDQRISLSYDCTFSLNEKARLYKMVKQWFGKVPAELNLSEHLIGKNCKLKVVNKVSGEKTYQNIISFGEHELLLEGSESIAKFPWLVDLAKGDNGLFGNLTEYVKKDDLVKAPEVEKVPAQKAQAKAPAPKAQPKVEEPEVDDLTDALEDM